MSTSRATKRHIIVFSFVLVSAVFLSTEARAVMYGSWEIVENNSLDPVTDQLSVDVTDEGSGQVKFLFINASGGDTSSITDIYFDDGSLLSIATINDSESGVSFSQFANPSELPGANNASPPFVTTAGFSADSDSPITANGVNPGETLGITFDLQTGLTFADVLDDLDDGSLRIGIHVQGIDGRTGDDSDAYILTPIPPSLIIGMLGMCVAGIKLRKYA